MAYSIKKCKEELSSLKDEQRPYIPNWNVATNLFDNQFMEDLNKINFSDNKENNYSYKNKHVPLKDRVTTFPSITYNQYVQHVTTGLCPISEVWFKLKISKQGKYSDNPEVTNWIEKLSEATMEALAKPSSGFYSVLPNIISQVALYGNSVMMINRNEGDKRKPFFFTSFKQGSYWLETNTSGEIHSFYRLIKLKVWEVIELYPDKKKYSDTLKKHIEKDRLNETVNIIHVIKKNTDYKSGKDIYLSTDKKYISLHFEESTNENKNLFLRESGLDQMPVFLTKENNIDQGSAYCQTSKCLQASSPAERLEAVTKDQDSLSFKEIHPSVLLDNSIYHDYDEKGHKQQIVVKDLKNMSYDPVRKLVDFNVDQNPLFNKMNMVSDEIREIFLIRQLSGIIQYAESEGQKTATEVVRYASEITKQMTGFFQPFRSFFLDPILTYTAQILVEEGFVDPPPIETGGTFEFSDFQIVHQSLPEQAIQIVKEEKAASNSRKLTETARYLESSPEMLKSIKIREVLKYQFNQTELPEKTWVTDEEYEKAEAAQRQALEQQAQEKSMIELGKLSLNNTVAGKLDEGMAQGVNEEVLSGLS